MTTTVTTKKANADDLVTLDNYALTLRLQDLATAISTGPRKSDLNLLTEEVKRISSREADLVEAVLALQGGSAPAATAGVTGPHVYVALSAMVESFSKVGLAKTRENTQGPKFKFRGIDELMNAASPLLAEHKLLVLPRVLSREVSERTTASGTVLFTVALDVEFDFVSAVDGSKHTVRTRGEAFDSGDKATNKAMSAAMKYALLQSWCIPLEGDNDADGTTHADITPKAATPPEGYAGYLGEAELAAQQGIPALRAFAKASQKPLWEWLLTKDAGKLEALQAIAKAVATDAAA